MTAGLDKERREMFRRLLDERGDRVYSFAMALTGSEQAAEEVTAEAFARALKNFARYDPSRPFESWLYKIVQNIHFDVSRRRKTRPTVSLDAADDDDGRDRSLGEKRGDRIALPDRELVGREEAGMVRMALTRVPEKFREPLTLCDVMGMSYEDISSLLRLPIGTVRSRIFRGRQIFRKIIEPYHALGGALWNAAKP